MQKEEQDLRDRTKAFALRIVRMFSALPKTTEAQVLGKQLLRSGPSIGANYREAFRARSKAEWRVLGSRDIDGQTREAGVSCLRVHSGNLEDQALRRTRLGE